MRSDAKVHLVCRDREVTADRTIELSRRALLRRGVGLFAWGSAVLAGQSRSAQATATRRNATRGANRASTSRASRQEALRQIPLRSLKEPLRGRVQKIVTDPTIYRRLPIQVIPCEPDLYLFLVRYPEVIVNMWQLMGVTKATIRRTGAYAYDAEDGAGTVSKVELVYGTRDQHLFLAEGFYEGPLVPRRVTGRCVLLLQSAYSQNQHQQSLVSNRLDVFLQLDRVGVELVAKTLHPLLGTTVDTNFVESTRFVGQVSQVAATNGPGVQRLASQLTKIEPQVRTKFLQIASAINQRAALRNMDETQQRVGQRLSDSAESASSRR
jgi:hypothetical protein